LVKIVFCRLSSKVSCFCVSFDNAYTLSHFGVYNNFFCKSNNSFLVVFILSNKSIFCWFVNYKHAVFDNENGGIIWFCMLNIVYRYDIIDDYNKNTLSELFTDDEIFFYINCKLFTNEFIFDYNDFCWSINLLYSFSYIELDCLCFNEKVKEKNKNINVKQISDLLILNWIICSWIDVYINIWIKYYCMYWDLIKFNKINKINLFIKILINTYLMLMLINKWNLIK
jgi:hypothetical protein